MKTKGMEGSLVWEYSEQVEDILGANQENIKLTSLEEVVEFLKERKHFYETDKEARIYYSSWAHGYICACESLLEKIVINDGTSKQR